MQRMLVNSVNARGHEMNVTFQQKKSEQNGSNERVINIEQ